MVPETRPSDLVAAVESARERPDEVFAIVAGLFVALVVAPVGVAAVAPALGGAGATYAALLAGLTVLTVGVALTVRHRTALPVWLGASRLRWLLPAGAIVPGTAVLLSEMVGWGVFAGPVGPLAALSIGGGVTAGLVLAMMASTRSARAVVAESETHVSWRAGWPSRWRRRTRVLAAVCVLAGAVSFLMDILADVGVADVLARVLFLLAVVLVGFGQERTYRATSSGLELKAPANRYLYTWERFAGYEVIEDAIVVRHRAWWRLPLYCDRSDIEDTDAVVGALDRYLDRV